jgi:crotonobetainyl-CoA:carnitine CoA-transferase CaiB-like acyl-CoA transferase
MSSSAKPPTGAALSGLKVLELAQLIAAPMAGTFLADLGAEVIHVEDPARGDPQRVTGLSNDDGVFLWWKVSGRNKRSVTINLRSTEGQDLARTLMAWADVLITNFRVGTLEKWGLDWAAAHNANPKLVMLQVTGFGAETALRNAPGFGKVGEAMSGVVHVTGFADGPPLHAGFSHADSVTGLMGAFAIQAALFRRSTDADFDGEWIDLSLFESLFRLIEWQVITHDQLGLVPTRAGNQLPISPAAVINTYRTLDELWVTVTSGTRRSVQNVAELVGQARTDFATVRQQEAGREHLDELLRSWVAGRTAEDAVAAMQLVGVTASRVFSMADIVEDESMREIGAIVEVDDPELGPTRMQTVIPRLRNYRGSIWRTGPSLGQDTDDVLRDCAGLSEARIAELRSRGVI